MLARKDTPKVNPKGDLKVEVALKAQEKVAKAQRGAENLPTSRFVLPTVTDRVNSGALAQTDTLVNRKLQIWPRDHVSCLLKETAGLGMHACSLMRSQLLLPLNQRPRLKLKLGPQVLQRFRKQTECWLHQLRRPPLPPETVMDVYGYVIQVALKI